MSWTESADAPIYARLVEELGDVPADVRHTVEQTMREVERTMNFRLPAGAYR